jgi:hypothetical protein
MEAATQTSVTGKDVAERLDDLFPTSEITAPPSAPPSPAPSTSEDVVRGEDVDARLNELFGEDDAPIAAESHVSFPPAEDFEATIQLPTLPPPQPQIDPEDLIDIDESSKRAPERPVAESSASETRFESKDDLDTQISGRETDAEELTKDHGSTMDLPALQEPDSWQPGSMLTSRSSDVDSQLDELFASSTFPKEQHFPPIASMPYSDAAATTGFARADMEKAAVNEAVTGDDINDRLDALFGEDSSFPSKATPSPSPSEAAADFAGIPTATLAEEYLRQGHREQALAVYRALVQKDPGNASYRHRLAEIQSQNP